MSGYEIAALAEADIRAIARYTLESGERHKLNAMPRYCQSGLMRLRKVLLFRKYF